jgi:hypothetical protein
MGHMDTGRRSRWLRGYDVHEIALVAAPDIGRRVLALKNKGNDTLGDDQLAVIDGVIRHKERVDKASRVAPMDNMGNPIEDPNSLSPQTQRTLQAVARLIAPHSGEVTMDDIQDVCRAVGLAPGDVGASGIQQDPNANGNGQDPDGGSDFLDDDLYAGDAPDDSFGDGDGDQDVGNEDAFDPDDGPDVDDVEGQFPQPGDDDQDQQDPNDADPDADPATQDPAQANADGPPAPPAKPTPAKGSSAGLAAALPKPAGVHPDDHATAADGVKGAYLDSLSKQGYNLPGKGNAPNGDGDAKDAGAQPDPKQQQKPKPPFPPKQQPPGRKPPPAGGKGKFPMPDKDAVNKHRIDLSKIPAEQRETIEMINKSARVAQQRCEQLEADKTELIEKHSALRGEVEELKRDRERQTLVLKTSSFSNLTDHEGLADTALALQGEAREKYLTQLSAQDAQIAEINKSKGAGQFQELGSRSGKEPVLKSGDTGAAKVFDELVETLVTKASDAGKELSFEEATVQVLKTKPGKAAYNAMENERMSRAPSVVAD